jgi:hypothetical protein
MHGYIIILPLPHMTSEARAYGISRELYNITVPLAIQEDYHKDGIVFGVVKHQDGLQCALHVDTEYVIPVHPLATLEKLVTLFPEIPETERTALQSFVLHNQAFPFGYIIPSTSTLRDHHYMIDNGWFPPDDFDV